MHFLVGVQRPEGQIRMNKTLDITTLYAKYKNTETQTDKSYM